MAVTEYAGNAPCVTIATNVFIVYATSAGDEPMTSSPTLGQVIRQRRLELGLTQEMLAERIGSGVRQAEVSRLEHDRVALPRKARLEQIARALDISIGALLARSGWAGAQEELGWTVTEARSSELPAAIAPVPVPAPQPASLELEQAPDLVSAIARAREIVEQTRAIMHEAQLSFERASSVSIAPHRQFSTSSKTPGCQ